MRRIAFFDFDGTITSKDTLLEFIKYGKGTGSFYIGFILNLPFLLAYKLKIISNQKAKEKILRFFFGGMPSNQFQEICDEFAAKKIPQLILPLARTEINRLKDIGAEIVIVSASPENWIKPWSESHDIKLIATKLEIKDGVIVGNIDGKNCHGEEKVKRIKAKYNLSGYEEIYCYGDSKSDIPMLLLGTTKFYKPFR